MAKLIDWIRQASVKLIDPQREERIGPAAMEVERAIHTMRQAFDFDGVIASLGIDNRDVLLVVDRVYERALGKAWADQVITPKERTALNWIAKALHLDDRRRQPLEERIGREVFQRSLAEALQDGHLDSVEAERLQAIASGMGTDLRGLMMGYFQNEGQGFLRGLFAQAIQDGRLSETEWNSLLATAHRLGLTESELRTSIQSQAQRFVEHVLADAKSDGRLSDDEDRTLTWLLDQLHVCPSFRKYVDEELRELRLWSAIAKGKLPSLPYDGVALKAGEIVHFRSSGRYAQVRRLKTGDRVDTIDGTITITDARVLFSSLSKSFEVSHSRITEVDEAPGGFSLNAQGKGAGFYAFAEHARLAYEIMRTAVGRANRRIVENESSDKTRRIPPEVRNRVWQRDVGQCVQCGATEYLEFDHIIPFSKGGSNSEQNIQLLCRRCNLQKRDRL